MISGVIGSIVKIRGMEHCDDRGDGHCDDEGNGAL